jgi:hypothetical protein
MDLQSAEERLGGPTGERHRTSGNGILVPREAGARTGFYRARSKSSFAMIRRWIWLVPS